VPLTYQGETIGALLVAPRARDEPFTPADRHVLADLARLAAVAVHAEGITADLRRSRERLVTAREEERRRLRNDLHDGLGPVLSGLTLKLETARNLFAHEPAVDAFLAEMTGRTQAAVADIRRLVYALRPPALDDLGLVATLREAALQHGAAGSGGPRVTVQVPERLPTLPAAVEVAAYRIAQEALTNVARHAGARTCLVRLAVDDGLCLEVVDDGRGIDGTDPAGVGLTSMRERAEELGGTFAVEAVASGGTRLRIWLPCPLATEPAVAPPTAELDRPDPGVPSGWSAAACEPTKA
jgi:signal transduction histidine kinase